MPGRQAGAGQKPIKRTTMHLSGYTRGVEVMSSGEIGQAVLWFHVPISADDPGDRPEARRKGLELITQTMIDGIRIRGGTVLTIQRNDGDGSSGSMGP